MVGSGSRPAKPMPASWFRSAAIDPDNEQFLAVGHFGDPRWLGDNRGAGHDRDSGKTGERGALDRLRTDRRQIETVVLTDFGSLHQDPDVDRRPYASAPPLLDDARQH